MKFQSQGSPDFSRRSSRESNSNLPHINKLHIQNPNVVLNDNFMRSNNPIGFVVANNRFDSKKKSRKSNWSLAITQKKFDRISMEKKRGIEVESIQKPGKWMPKNLPNRSSNFTPEILQRHKYSNSQVAEGPQLISDLDS